MSIQSNRLLLIVSGWILLLTGCGPQGPDLGPFGLVSGRVTYEGKPIALGMITFNSPQTGHVATADLEPDGSYTMRLNDRDGLPLGHYNICVRPPLTVQHETDPSKVRRNNLYAPTISKDIPMKYRFENSSGLEATVQEDENLFDFNLLRDKGKN
jgi:hypothetical protein